MQCKQYSFNYRLLFSDEAKCKTCCGEIIDIGKIYYVVLLLEKSNAEHYYMTVLKFVQIDA